VNTGVRQSPMADVNAQRNLGIAEALDRLRDEAEATAVAPSRSVEQQARVFIAAENRLLREALARMLAKRGGIEIVGLNSATPLDAATLTAGAPEVLLLISDGCVEKDLATIQQVRTQAPKMRILVIGITKDHGEFLRCVRAGINGYLFQDSRADEVLEGIRAVQAGEAVCPGALCNVLFQYFEGETSGLPCASIQQRLGLTRREQQLIPLIAKGFTNKEIANHFCLSEQTVKNHLYRMKHKIGAEDRLGIVQTCRTQGFLV
jgi:DNA-binding NarL/FixJ family response regulator